MSMVINGTSGITFPDGSLQGIGVGRRNLIINGAMQVAQRGTSFATIIDNQYTVDRFVTEYSGLGAFNISQSSDAPDGFGSSFKVDCTTADASPAAGDVLAIFYKMEGQDAQQLKKGTANAESVTLSFYVKSNKTGTYQVNIRDIDNNRIIGSTYTVNSSGAWEYKTVTFIGDTSGSLGNDNGESIRLDFMLGSGTDYSSGTVPTTWKTRSNVDRNAGATVNLADSTSNYFQITGVQLEVGSVATPFEHRSYGEELALCQRYYALIANSSSSGEFGFASGFQTSTGGAVVQVQTPVPMRAAPTATASNLGISNQVNFTQAATLAYSGLTNSGGLLGFTYSSAGAQYSPCLLVSQSTLIGNLSFSSEL
jgi:hypothetical protein